MKACATGKNAMRHYADGGEIDPEMQRRIDENKAKFNAQPKPSLFSGIFGSKPAQPQPSPTAQQPSVVSSIQNRNEELKKAANYANGGVVKPTIVVPDGVDMNAYTQEQGSGRGVVDAAGRVVDSLPYAAAQFVPGLNVPLGAVAGAVHAAQGRYEQLPIDAASMLGGKPAGVLLQKGKQLQNAMTKQKVIGGIGRTTNAVQALGAADAFGAPAYACGGKVKAHAQGGKIKGPGTPTSDSIDAKVKQTGEPIKVSTGERVVSAEQDALLQGIAQKMGFKSLDALLEHGTGKPVGPTMKGGMAHAATGDKIEEEGWAAGGDKPLTAADIVQSSASPGIISNVGQPHPSIGANYGVPPVAAPASAVAPVAGGMSTAAGPKVGDTVVEGPAPARTAFDNPANTPRPAQGVNANLAQGLATQVNAGVIRQGNSFTGTGPGIKEDMSKPLTSIDMNANNASMQKANDIRQSMIDSQAGYRAEPGSSGGRIADSGRVEGDALLAKWGRESAAKDAMQMAANNPRAAQAIASTYGANVQGETALARDATDQMRNESNNATLRRGQDLGAQTDQGRQKVAMRGQDIGALSDQAKLGILDRDSQRSAEKFGIDKQIAQGQLEDSNAQRTARAGLSAAIASGNPKAINKAKTLGIAAGLKFDEERANKPIAMTDAMGAQSLVTDNRDGTFTTMKERGAAAATPSYDAYAAQIRAKNKGITDEQIRAGYAKNFGGK